MRSIDVEEAAAVSAEHLDRDLRGDWADRNGLLRALQRGGVDIIAERLRDALPDQEQRIRYAKGNKDVERAARDIDPEIADGTNRVAGETANQRQCQRNAGCRRQIVLVGQAEHLHEIRHRPLAAVVLPVGISDEADRRIKRQIGSDSRLVRRIERQPLLHAHQHIKNQKPADVKQQHANRIGHRMLFLALVNAADLVDGDLDRTEDWREPRPFAVEHARHIGAEHRRNRNDDDAIEQNLPPTDGGHGRLSFRTARA